jgi:biopolymer transport protein ExbB
VQPLLAITEFNASASVFDRFWQEASGLFLSGGWLMIPLAGIAILIYWTAFETYYYFNLHKFYRTPKEKVAKCVLNPILADGELRMILDYSQNGAQTTDDVRNRFAEMRSAYLAKIDRHRRYLYILISIAPLMGLLGTVTGMLETFRGLSSGGGDTVDMIAGGISEALITTQTGLMIAIPAYVIAYLILKRRNEMDACLQSMETLTVQIFEKNALQHTS